MSTLTGVSVNMQHPSGLLLRLPPAQREARATRSCEFATEGHMLLCRNEFRSGRIFLRTSPRWPRVKHSPWREWAQGLDKLILVLPLHLMKRWRRNELCHPF